MAQRPRLEYYPRDLVAYDIGDEAIALAARAGLVLDPWQCDALRIMLSFKDDDTFVCPDYCELVARQNGKGAILEARALAGLFLLGEQLIMWTAHEVKTTNRAFRRFEKLISNLVRSGDLAEDDVIVRKANGQQGFEIPAYTDPETGDRVEAREINFIARSKGSGRGFTGNLVIIDEAYDYTVDQAAALEPTMLAIDNPQTIYTSTPPLSGDTGGPLYDLRERALGGADDQLGYRDWGLDMDLEDIEDIDVHDERLWEQTNPSLDKRIRRASIRRLIKKLGKAGFARESLGIWPRRLTTAPGSITAEQWEAVGDAFSAPDLDHGIVVAFSVTGGLDRSSVGIAGLREDGLGHMELIYDEPGTQGLVKFLAGLRERRDPKLFVMNGKGATAAFAAELIKAGFEPPEDKAHPQRGALITLGPADVADSFALFVNAVRNKRVRHRAEPRVASSLATAGTRSIGVDGKAWKQAGANPISLLEALTFAHWAEETQAHLVVEYADPNVW